MHKINIHSESTTALNMIVKGTLIYSLVGREAANVASVVHCSQP